MVARVAHGLMSLLFIFGAAVQLNDPDPVGWTLIYLAAAAAAALSALRSRRAVIVAAAVGAAALFWSITIAVQAQKLVPFTSLFRDFEMKSRAIEETREVFGLLIIATWMAAVGWTGRRLPPR